MGDPRMVGPKPTAASNTPAWSNWIALEKCKTKSTQTNKRCALELDKFPHELTLGDVVFASEIVLTLLSTSFAGSHVCGQKKPGHDLDTKIVDSVKIFLSHHSRQRKGRRSRKESRRRRLGLLLLRGPNRHCQAEPPSGPLGPPQDRPLHRLGAADPDLPAVRQTRRDSCLQAARESVEKFMQSNLFNSNGTKRGGTHEQRYKTYVSSRYYQEFLASSGKTSIGRSAFRNVELAIQNDGKWKKSRKKKSKKLYQTARSQKMHIDRP